MNVGLHAVDNFKPAAVVVIMIRNAGAHGVGDMAAAVGYYGVLAILPLLLFTITVLSYVFETERVVSEVHLVISQYVPVEDSLVGDNVEAIVRSRGVVGVVSALALAWSGSNVFGAMSRFMDKAWGVRNSDAFHLVRIKSLLTVGSVGALVLMSITAASVVHTTEQIAASGWLSFLQPFVEQGGRVVLGLTSLTGTIVSALLLYRWLPSDRIAWRYCVPAAIIAGVSMAIVKNAFLFYLTNIASFEAVYGSLASGVVLLLWIFVTALVLLVVAEFGGALREVNFRSRRAYPPTR